MRQDFFVYQWFQDNHLLDTLFQVLPLELLIKIWKLKRKYELNPIKNKLLTHFEFLNRRYGTNVFWGPTLFPYRNENNIHIVPTITESRNQILFEMTFWQLQENTDPHKLFVFEIASVNRLKRKIFSFSVLEDNQKKRISYENNSVEPAPRYEDDTLFKKIFFIQELNFI
jgi:hypothetical protein